MTTVAAPLIVGSLSSALAGLALVALLVWCITRQDARTDRTARVCAALVLVILLALLVARGQAFYMDDPCDLCDWWSADVERDEKTMRRTADLVDEYEALLAQSRLKQADLARTVSTVQRTLLDYRHALQDILGLATDPEDPALACWQITRLAKAALRGEEPEPAGELPI